MHNFAVRVFRLASGTHNKTLSSKTFRANSNPTYLLEASSTAKLAVATYHSDSPSDALYGRHDNTTTFLQACLGKKVANSQNENPQPEILPCFFKLHLPEFR